MLECAAGQRCERFIAGFGFVHQVADGQNDRGGHPARDILGGPRLGGFRLNEVQNDVLGLLNLQEDVGRALVGLEFRSGALKVKLQGCVDLINSHKRHLSPPSPAASTSTRRPCPACRHGRA